MNFQQKLQNALINAKLADMKFKPKTLNDYNLEYIKSRLHYFRSIQYNENKEIIQFYKNKMINKYQEYIQQLKKEEKKKKKISFDNCIYVRPILDN